MIIIIPVSRTCWNETIEARSSRGSKKWKTLNNNDLNQVADQQFSLKQWFAAGAHSCRLRKPGSGHCYYRFFVQKGFCRPSFLRAAKMFQLILKLPTPGLFVTVWGQGKEWARGDENCCGFWVFVLEHWKLVMIKMVNTRSQLSANFFSQIAVFFSFSVK